MLSNENVETAVPEMDSVKIINTKAAEDPEPVETAELVEEIRKALIYCGPSLPKGILTQYLTYRGGYPKYLEPHIAKCPAISRLFVLPEKLTSTIAAINRTGTSENVWKNEILDYIKGGIK